MPAVLPVHADPETDAVLAGGGALGGLIRAHDWSATPLGPPGTWPQALKTLVAVMLGSRQPMFITWGPERIMLYNDGYAPILGARHPGALGAPFPAVWFDIQADVAPILDRAYAGEGTHMDDITLVMTRNGYPEETHFSFSYTPVRDETGAVAGMFCACAETTGRVLVERRQHFRLVLEERLRDLADPREVMAAAAELLGHHLRCDRAGYAEIGAEDDLLTVVREWCAPGMPALEGRRRPLADFGPVLAEGLRAGRIVAFTDALDGELAAAEATDARFAAACIRAGIAVPLVKAGRLAAAFFAHAAVPRRWTEEEQSLVREVAERTWAALGRARAEAALRESEARWRGLFTRMHEGFALCEMVHGSDGRAVDFRYLEVNHAWETLTGVPAAQVLGRLASEAIPGIEPFWAETYGRVAETGEPAHFEFRLAALDRWFEVLAYRTEPGRFAALFLNVTGRKLAEERQALLAREVDHRAKNALAVVQSVLRLTRAPDLPAFVRAVEGRVAALARAQSLLADDRWHGADLRALLEAELAPFLAGQQVELDGPGVVLPVRAAQPVAMAVHELATNAVKHGALSVPGGRLSVHWTLGAGATPLLRLRWVEAGGPAIPQTPTRRGFGSRVLDGTIRGQLGGSIDLSWEPTGLACDLCLPLRGDADWTLPGPAGQPGAGGRGGP
ncbi:PAS domain-containing sensor histidine kinase [Roseicella aquatilis]|uniref:histidine kinase n=1 Tax=Roseicella aquatilis TaxID=2527868 RepID=A0A4R4D2U8_9PROT|nr:HWE histidine kinase domain-containing protein [Roseicella aquatilis]TCZ52743.1 PAS domain-containing protein [Roseicella aquatilis]